MDSHEIIWFRTVRNWALLCFCRAGAVGISNTAVNWGPPVAPSTDVLLAAGSPTLTGNWSIATCDKRRLVGWMDGLLSHKEERSCRFVRELKEQLYAMSWHTKSLVCLMQPAVVFKLEVVQKHSEFIHCSLHVAAHAWRRPPSRASFTDSPAGRIFQQFCRQ